MLATHEDLRRKITEMEKRYDSKFHAVFATLRQMLETPIPPKRQIGFHSEARQIQEGGLTRLRSSKSLNYIYLFIHNPHPGA